MTSPFNEHTSEADLISAINANPRRAIRDLLATGLFSGPKVNIWEGAGVVSIPVRILYCSLNSGSVLCKVELEVRRAPADPNAYEVMIKTRDDRLIPKWITVGLENAKDFGLGEAQVPS